MSITTLEACHTLRVSGPALGDRLRQTVKTPVQAVEVPVHAVVLRSDDPDEARQHVDGLVEPRVGRVEPRVRLVQTRIRAALLRLDAGHAAFQTPQALVGQTDDLAVTVPRH